MGKIIGIDLSKQAFDVCFNGKGRSSHKVFGNNLYGFGGAIDLYPRKRAQNGHHAICRYL